MESMSVDQFTKMHGAKVKPARFREVMRNNRFFIRGSRIWDCRDESFYRGDPTIGHALWVVFRSNGYRPMHERTLSTRMRNRGCRFWFREAKGLQLKQEASAQRTGTYFSWGLNTPGGASWPCFVAAHKLVNGRRTYADISGQLRGRFLGAVVTDTLDRCFLRDANDVLHSL